MDVEIEFSDFIKFPLKCLKFIGLIPAGEVETGLLKRKLLALVNRVVLVNLSITLLLMMIFVLLNISELSIITGPTSTIGYIGLAIVKSISISSKIKEFKDLIETLNDLFPKSKEEQKAFGVVNYRKGYRRMENFFIYLNVSVGVFFTVVPIVKFLVSGIWINKLPFDSWFPFDEYDPRCYNFILLSEIFCSIMTLAVMLGSDLCLISFIILISMKFDVLCQRLQQLEDSESIDVHKKFVEFVKLHETLIRLSKNLEKIFTYPIFINFFGSSIFICLNVHQASMETSIANYFRSANLIIASMLQIFLICYYGNKLTSAAENLTNAVFNSGWNKQMRDRKYFLLMMIQRSQKPTVLSALKFSAVSLRSFTTVSIQTLKFIYEALLMCVFQILSWAYSYLTLLRTKNSNWINSGKLKICATLKSTILVFRRSNYSFLN